MNSLRFGAVHVKQFKMKVDDQGNTTYKLKATTDDVGTKDKDVVETFADNVDADTLTLKTTLAPNDDVKNFNLSVGGNSTSEWGRKTSFTVDATPETQQEYNMADTMLSHIKGLPEKLVKTLRKAMDDHFYLIK